MKERLPKMLRLFASSVIALFAPLASAQGLDAEYRNQLQRSKNDYNFCINAFAKAQFTDNEIWRLYTTKAAYWHINSYTDGNGRTICEVHKSGPLNKTIKERYFDWKCDLMVKNDSLYLTFYRKCDDGTGRIQRQSYPRRK